MLVGRRARPGSGHRLVDADHVARPALPQPHPFNNLADHFFERLVGKDAKEHLQPLLAESWKVVNETTWEFKLRKGVKWHDGSDFTAEDVVASVKRILERPEYRHRSPCIRGRLGK